MIIFGLYILVAMMIVSGMAYDIMRFETERVRMQSALDRSVLAAASLSQPLDAADVVRSYFDKANLDNTGIQVDETIGMNFRTVAANTTVSVPTRFMRMVDRTMLVGQLSPHLAVHDGVFHLRTGAGAAAEESIGNIEISLVVDVSTSMETNSRIGNLRNAAREFSWRMLCDPRRGSNVSGNCSVVPGTVSISMVPFAEQVNVGAGLLNAIDKFIPGDPAHPVLSRYDVTNEHDNSHCVTFNPVDYPETQVSVTDAVKRTGHFDPWSTSGSAADWVCKTEDWRVIRPIIGHHSNLNHLIGQIRAGGKTSIDVGMKWGAALLDPELRPVIASLSTTARVGGATATEPNFDDRPLDYDRPDSIKVIVVMSDGENTKQHELLPDYRDGPSEFWKSVPDPADDSDPDGEFYVIYNENLLMYYYPTFPLGQQWFPTPDIRRSSCTVDGVCLFLPKPDQVHQMDFPELWAEVRAQYYESFDWLNTPYTSTGNAVKNQRTREICDAAKARDIIIFAIGFEAPANGRAVLRNCASTHNHYYDATGLEIEDAFVSIAAAINNLRLTQ